MIKLARGQRDFITINNAKYEIRREADGFSAWEVSGGFSLRVTNESVPTRKDALIAISLCAFPNH